MNPATRAFISGLLVVGLVTMLVAVVLMGREHEHRAEHTSAPPHVARPEAGATGHLPDFDMADAILMFKAAEADNFRRYLEALARQRESAARVRVSRRSTSTSRPRSGSSESAFLACVKYRESRGDYRAVNPSSGTGGAYQFEPGTARATARHAGRDDLANTPPQDWSPADQDAMARALYEWQGRAPWSGGSYSCG